MSLELSGTDPKILVFMPWDAPAKLLLSIEGRQHEIPADDIAELVKYWLTNSDLGPADDDPRAKLVRQIQGADLGDGFASGRKRIILPTYCL